MVYCKSWVGDWGTAESTRESTRHPAQSICLVGYPTGIWHLLTGAECQVRWFPLIIYSETQPLIKFNRQFDPSSLKLVIFDLDGTLIDSRLDLVHSVNATLRHMKRPELAEDLIASYVGDGAPVLIGRALGAEATDEALVKSGLEYFLSYYREHKLDHTRVYDGIPQTLAAIRGGQRGCKLAVLSNKPVAPSRAIVEALGLGKFFVSVYGGNSFATKKPDPLGAQTILWETGASAEQTLIVGDSQVDIATGRNAGLWTCGVTYGFAPHTLEDPPPDVVVDNAKELARMFRQSWSAEGPRPPS